MQKNIIFSLLLVVLFLGLTTVPGLAQTETPGTESTITPSVPVTLAETDTTTPVVTVVPERPVVILDSYGVTGDNPIKPGQEFDLSFTLLNTGKDYAENISMVFGGTDFLPVNTGGVRVHNELDPKESVKLVQRFIANPALGELTVSTLPVILTYSALATGTSYTETLNITIRLQGPVYSSGPAQPTRTPTQVSRPQLVVGGYQANVDPLQPGSTFELQLDIQNLGTADARSVTMVLGGGATATDPNGTAVPGGDISGGSSELSVFAPLGSSNLIFLGDIPQGSKITTKQNLIVNVTANPGAYAFKISFVYDDSKGARLVNDQVITMLVYQLPQVEVGFYRDPGIFFTGQPNVLPLQVTNLGRKTSVMGNMKVTAANADVTSNVSLVGSLDPGGYFTLDANLIPYQGGPLEVQVEVGYTDDFNQPRIITQTLTLDVQEMPTPEVLPSDNGMGTDIPPVVEETLWDKIVRAFKGLLGLDSSQPTTTPDGSIPLDGNTVPEGKTSEPPVQVVPVPKG